MSKVINIVTSGTLSVMMGIGVTSPAFATPDQTDTINTTAPTTINKEQLNNILIGTNPTKFSAKIYITDSNGTELIEVSKSNTTLKQALKTRDLDAGNFRTSEDKPIHENTIISNNEKIVIFQSEITGTSEIIKLPALETEKETDDLYVGETKVEYEGKDGEAVKTIITTKDLSADNSVNTENTKKREDTTTEEKLTVLIQPEAKVTLIGTKERPVVTTTPITTRPTTTTTTTPTTVSNNTVTSTEVENNPKETDSLKSTTDDATIQLILDQVGKPYILGATGPDAFDCSGLVYWIYSVNGNKKLPRTAASQGAASTPVSIENMQPGDIIWSSGHIGIYVGNGQMVHAARPGRGVVIYNVNWYLNDGMKIGRL